MQINHDISLSNSPHIDHDIHQPLLVPHSTMNSNQHQVDRTIDLFDLNAKSIATTYTQNVIVTSRYSLVSFFPKSLFEQFRRLANVYFLVIGIIAIVGTYTDYYESSIQPEAILAPMMIVVMISVIKDGIEDLKRHTADSRINSRPTRRIRPTNSEMETVMWKDLKVGDLLILFGDDEIPADCLVLACGGVQGETCFVETAAIDGETNLKVKLPCFLPKKEFDLEKSSGLNGDDTQKGSIIWDKKRNCVHGVYESSKYSASVTAEPPNGSIHRFNGYIDLHERNASRQSIMSTTPLGSEEAKKNHRGVDGLMEEAVQSDSSNTINLTEKHLLLRGSVLRASEWCIGAVIYTGADTKLSLNSKKTPSKLSSVDRIVNRTMLIAITTMFLVCIMSMILSIVWQNDNLDSDYLCLSSTDLATFTRDGSGGCTSGATNSYLTFFTFATLYNNFVCISMYVSLEMVYLCQSFFLSNDLTLYDETTDTPSECHSSGMCADLGQVQYVLSDKTGTLTKNQMVVKQFSIGNIEYCDDGYVGTTGQPEPRPSNHSQTSSLHISISPLQASASSNGLSNANGLRDGILPLTHASKLSSQMDGSGQKLGSELLENQLKMDFLRTLVYCNTAMLMPDTTTGKVNVFDFPSLKSCLQAESPDEVALILAAAEHCGIVLTKRYNEEMESLGMKNMALTSSALNQLASTAPDLERVQVLAINEFESDRKMMSIVVRFLDFFPQPNASSVANNQPVERLLLLCKGADSSVLAQCNSAYSPYTIKCMHHIDQFASTGLRTLVAACRELDPIECEAWLKEYKFATNSLSGRAELLSECAKKIEVNLQLLGAVGIEDELQDGVPESIEMLRMAGLNVWMITGDKAETAVAIGKKCNLITEAHHELERVVNLTEGEALRQRIFDLHSLVMVKKQRPPELNVANPNLRLISNSYGNTTDSKSSQSIQHKGKSNSSIKVLSTVNPSNPNDGLRPSSIARGKNSEFRDESDIIDIGSHVSIISKEVALIVDGISLEGLWASKDLKIKFIESIQNIPTVIACRVSPLQKAALVRMIKAAPDHPTTLAIGDGANDVGMIHESRIGVGISGKEGRHAANSADFAISQFRFLVPLLFEHGRFNYIRCSKLVLYSFFKNLLLVSILFYYCFYSGFSGTVPLDTILFSGYNFYLGLPVLALGAMDMDIPRKDVYHYPYLSYATGRNGELLNLMNMTRWCLFAFIQGLLLFIVAMRFIGGPTETSTNDGLISLNIYGTGINNINHGWSLGIFPAGYLIYTSAVVAMQYKIVAMTETRTSIFWIVWILSFMGYVLFSYLYGVFSSLDWYNVIPLIFGQPEFWLAILLIPVMLSVSDWVIEQLWAFWMPSSVDMLKRKLQEDEEKRDTTQRNVPHDNMKTSSNTGLKNFLSFLQTSYFNEVQPVDTNASSTQSRPVHTQLNEAKQMETSSSSSFDAILRPVDS